jgi:hypothetical protein
MKPAAALFLAALALSACQDADKSYDASYGPENVLMAPLFSEANRQVNPKNRELMELAKKDSLFFAKKKEAVAATPDSAAPSPVVADTAAAPAPAAPAAPATSAPAKH